MKKYDTDAIKAKYDLAYYIAQDLGQKLKYSGAFATFKCPFHNDRSPSLIANSKSCTCLAGCHELQGADIITYVCATRHINFQEACAYLEGETKHIPIVKKVIEVPKKDYTHTFTAKIKSLSRNLKIAQPYFESRGIRYRFAERGLTMDDVFDVKSREYEFISGEKIRIYSPRYTIPRIWKDLVYSVNTRLNDAYVDTHFLQNDENLYRIIEDYYQRNGVLLSPYEVKDMLFPRYKKWYGGRTLGVSNMGNFLFQDGQRKPLSSMIFFENEMNAFALNDWQEKYGYNATAMDGLVGLRWWTKEIDYVLFVADNDPDKIDQSGRTKSVGWEKMSAAYDIAQHPNASIVRIPEGKSIDDFRNLKGDTHVEAWLGKYGITPIERRYLQ